MNIHILGSGAYPLRFQDGRSLSLLLPDHGIIIDAGLGLTALPKDYKTETLFILLSHFHHDHILGLAFLANILEAGQCKKIIIYGDDRIQQLLAFFKEPFNPDYTSQQMPITMEFLPEEITLGKVTVKRKNVPHSSGKSNYFTFSADDGNFAFGTDTTADPKNADFLKGNKILFHECNFDNAHKNQAIKEGHSYPDAVAELAKAADINQLYVIHTDPRFPSIKEEIRKAFPSSELTYDDQIIVV